MVLLVAEYQVQAGQGDYVAAALADMAPRVMQGEPGCLVYEAHRAQDDPDRFLLYEVYESEEALQAHRETPYFRSIIEGQVVPRLVKRERRVYTPILPVIPRRP
jgi:autoinducer 2-degrading protein